MLMQHTSQASRPQTMAQHRQKGIHSSLSNNYISYRNPEQHQENSHRYQKQYVSNRTNNDRQFVYVVIPKNITQSNLQHSQQQRKSTLYSRENIQLINKKNREIRSSKFSQSIGIYDVRNDRAYVPTRIISSAMTDYVENLSNRDDIKPIIRSVKKTNNIKNAKTVKLSRNLVLKSEGSKEMEIQQGVLKSKSSLNQRKRINSLKQIDKKTQKRAQIQKVTGGGYIVNKFESKLKKKCVEDNLNVMATLLKRKMRVMDKQDMVSYLKKFMNRNSVHK